MMRGQGRGGRAEEEEAKRGEGKAISSALLLHPLPPPASTSHGRADRGKDRGKDEGTNGGNLRLFC